MLHSGVGVLRSGQAEADRFFKKAYRLARVNELVELLLALDVNNTSSHGDPLLPCVARKKKNGLVHYDSFS